MALRKNKSVEQLWLNGNYIGSAGAEAIAGALVVNRTLKTLGLDDNDIGNYGGQQIKECLRYNRVIRDIFLDGNRVSERTVGEICCRCEKNAHESMIQIKAAHESLHGSRRMKASGKQYEKRSRKSFHKLPPIHEGSGMRRTAVKRNSFAARCA